MKFDGKVGSRSSTVSGGPPGEAEVLGLNPERRERILAATGWTDVCPGTLNLEVTEDGVHRLLLCTPTIRERGEDVRYPPGRYAGISNVRVGYLYYIGSITSGDETETVVFRRACNPLPKRIEVFSQVKLRERLKLSDGRFNRL